MKHTFTLSYFPDANLEIETSIWTGKSNLWKDGELFERSSEKGKPFLVPNAAGEIVKIYPKPTPFELVPALEINGSKHYIVEKLPWYKYAIALLPLLLVLIDGATGGLIGAVSSILNVQLFRKESSESLAYWKVLGITVLAYIAYFSIVAMLLPG